MIETARRYLKDIGPLVDEQGRHTVRRDWQTTVAGIEVRLLARLNKARERRAELDEAVLKQYAVWGLPWAAAELKQREA
ncbi:hypothetical protein ACFYXH_22630 [Streptomyces sp. NPDC002730]|uniref:hypothetical protein n=1 Tax=Streptomyces sp. NPDC002730 TaxID=3364662 RepID=UPI0036CC23C1